MAGSNVYHALAEAGHGRFGEALLAFRSGDQTPAAKAALSATLRNAGVEHAVFDLQPTSAVTRADADLLFHKAEEDFRWALASFNQAVRRTILARATELVDRGNPHLGLRLELLRLWDQLASGESNVEGSSRVLLEARGQGLPRLAVEAEVVRGWSALLDGDLAGALSVARRASRMASTERLLVPECLAHILLGHIRRELGKPYLCVRILTGLRGVVPTLWHRWIDWELGFAGGAGPVNEIVHAKRNGQASLLSSSSEQLGAEASAFAPLKRQLDGLLCGLDPDRVPDERFPFLRGQRSKAGYIWAAEGDSDGAMAFVRTGSGARKILSVALLENADMERIPLGARQNTRPLTCLVDLAFRPQSSASALFERVYGFGFVPAKHDGSFRVMLHRARQLCEGLADIDRSGDAVNFRVHRPFLVADPQSSIELDERVLALVGKCQGSPAAIAESLGITTRAVQQILKRLYEDGVCARDKVGRAHAYRVVDTTFTVPSYR